MKYPICLKYKFNMMYRERLHLHFYLPESMSRLLRNVALYRRRVGIRDSCHVVRRRTVTRFPQKLMHLRSVSEP